MDMNKYKYGTLTCTHTGPMFTEVYVNGTRFFDIVYTGRGYCVVYKEKGGCYYTIPIREVIETLIPFEFFTQPTEST